MVKIAICDDQESMAGQLKAAITRILEAWKEEFRVTCFGSPHRLLLSSPEFDLIFLDIRMEKPDGIETARLREQALLSFLPF